MYYYIHTDILIKRVSHVQVVEICLYFLIYVYCCLAEPTDCRCTLLSALSWAPNSGLRHNHTWALLWTLLYRFFSCGVNQIVYLHLFCDWDYTVYNMRIVIYLVFFLINRAMKSGILTCLFFFFIFVCLLYVHSLLVSLKHVLNVPSAVICLPLSSWISQSLQNRGAKVLSSFVSLK